MVWWPSGTSVVLHEIEDTQKQISASIEVATEMIKIACFEVDRLRSENDKLREKIEVLENKSCPVCAGRIL